MPRKRKHPKITVKASPPPEAPAMAQAPVNGVPIRCIWDGRLVISGAKMPSGNSYEFEAGQSKPVDVLDYQSLLNMETMPSGCCGGSVRSQKFFEVV